ncbi:RNA polymerase sigma factor [Anaerocolumna sp. MB42-C2]|uniref:RNA polymerase sigma factor n=1 Tax=Anaerocolumna sp. MB42-C2 TaxID=3070997 RepID=UPI0027E1DA50|nr:sigma-70 family RNA polymerase sigma factor [Anaerocolumna sp. MB42-C2]WMJ85573.1 sigma-70 family RNA polymerase sigma factor [Anaerocolumna sp. MB42-C2]
MGVKNNSDSEFFEELCNRHYSKIYNFCKKLLYGYNSDFAEECTQNTFLEARKQITKLKTHPNIEGWLYTTSRNQINSFLRKQHVIRKYEVIFDEESFTSLAVLDNNIEKLFEEDINVEQLALDVLKSLSNQERDLYNAYYKKHLQIIDLSNKYNISTTAVTTRIYRLNKKIKNIIHTYLDKL